MAEEPEFRLWSERRKTREHQKQTVIARLKSPTGPLVPAEMSMAAESARRGARRGVAGGAAASRLARIREYGYVASVKPVFSERAPPARSRASLRHLGVESAPAEGEHRQAARSEGLVEIRVARGTDPKKLARHVAGMGDVEYAFVPPVRRPFGGRSAGGPDSLASRQWSHGAIRLGHARSASRFSDASDLVVAVVDSGIDEDHPDLEGVIKEYRSFLKGEGKRDYIGHGTHVSGIISGSYRNGLGIGGICGARILALKALPHDDDDWNATDYYNALRYVIGRAHVLNLSLGGEKDRAEIDVLRDVIDSGVVVVAAMGNEYEEGNPVEYPAAMPEVCAVGATDHFDRRAGFSNTGRHIDLVAPGVQILSTTPTYEYDEPERTYALWDGTSMASPHVAAAAALVLARHPGSTPAQVIQRLASSADRVAGAKKGSASYGAGRLNCEDALA